jgi:MFS family permease
LSPFFFADSFPQLWHLIILQGVIFGLSAGILYAPIVMWLSDWFVIKRGLAGGIIFGGSGVGGFVFPLAMGYLLDAVGFRWTLRFVRGRNVYIPSVNLLLEYGPLLSAFAAV